MNHMSARTAPTGFLYAFVSFLEAIAMAWQANLIGSILDALGAGEAPWPDVYWYIASILAVLSLEWMGQVLLAQYKRMRTHDLRTRIVNSTLTNSTKWHNDASGNASIVSHLNTNVPTVVKEYYEARLNIIVNALMAIVYFCALAMIGLQYALVVTLFAGGTVLIPLLHRRRISAARADSLTKQENLNKGLEDSLRCYLPLRLTNSLPWQRQRVIDWSHEQATAEFRYGARVAFSNISVGTANFCGRLALIILGIVLISNGLSSVGNFVSAFQLLSLMIAPVVRAAQILNIHGAGRSSMETLFAEYPLAFPTPRRSATERLEIPDAPTLSLTDLLVSPGGRDDTPRSRVANTVIPFGSNWRIAGPSGCGKTTLCGVIAGVHPPCQGEVTVDRRPVSGFDETSRFRWLQYVPQDAHLVQASVWDNVMLGRSLPSSVVKDALERAGFELHGDHVPSLEQRDPLEWSGGERQRICLARALCLRPRLLILDEGLSQVDTATRNSILQRLLSDRELTFIFVSHHEFDGDFGTIEVRKRKEKKGDSIHALG